VSIIEKAAGKLGQDKESLGIIEKAGSKPGQSKGSESIIEKAANKLGQSEEQVTPPLEIINTISSNARQKAADAHGANIPDRKIHKRVELNLSQLHHLGMVTPDQGKTLVAEEFRLIKRPLIKNAFNQASGSIKHGNLIMVTSSLPKEGKTFCAINLAMSIAMEMDHTVLLVDADVARPSILRTLGLKAEIGLMDILLDDKLDLADVMLKTNVETLSILPAGKSHKHATELLASQVMSSLLDEIANRYPDRIVIFDSPPLLLTTEASVLASHMGQIVMVVEAETTTQHAVKDALRQIETCANINLVYNKAKTFPGGNYYGYY
jgi:protein-tyrosine kinase